ILKYSLEFEIGIMAALLGGAEEECVVVMDEGEKRQAGEIGATEKETDAGRSVVIPWLIAEADPTVYTPGEWWKKLRRSPKRLGEVSQAAFLLKAKMMGLNVALPWGDSERYDFVVWADAGKSARATRVQVKGTGRLYMRGYEVQPVRSTRGRGKLRYTTREVDVIAAHVQPVDVWYLIPMEEVGRARSLRFYPDIESREPLWEKWREAWEVLGCR
ncbi:MAG: group I intron-associated PD-(D/E)XK endonuclease, partial [Candidatus Sulfotelmatobacter sp.]